MAEQLPGRPSFEFLRKLAKGRLRELRRLEPGAKLAAAQLLVARGYGFGSWRKLKEHVEGLGAVRAGGKVEAFLEAAVSPVGVDPTEGSLVAARGLLREEPGLGGEFLVACVLGDARGVEGWLEKEPGLARTKGGGRGWVPLLYLCYSRYLRLEKKREEGFVQAARALVRHGADVNSLFEHNGFHETALYGAAGVANAPKLTKFLLEAGADPDDMVKGNEGKESLYHACEHADNACLKLLLAAGPARNNVSHCLGRKLDFEDIEGVRLMLDHGADPNVGKESKLMHAIRRGRSVEILELLIARGADVMRGNGEGMTPLRLARRMGQVGAVACLERHGAREAMDGREAFLAACAAGDLRGARKVLKAEPGLVGRLSDEEKKVLPDAAAGGNVKAVRVMLELGWPIDAIGDWGGSAAHQAAWRGQVAVVKLLIQRGADLRQKQGFGGDVLNTAIHGAKHGGHSRGVEVVKVVARGMEGAVDWERYLKGAREMELGEVVGVLEGMREEKR